MRATAPLILGSAWRRWSGYAVASSYEAGGGCMIANMPRFDNAAGLSTSRRSTNTNPRARWPHDCSNRIITRNVMKMQVGQVFYNPGANAHGKVSTMARWSRLCEQTYRLTSAETHVPLSASERSRSAG